MNKRFLGTLGVLLLIPLCACSRLNRSSTEPTPSPTVAVIRQIATETPAPTQTPAPKVAAADTQYAREESTTLKLSFLRPSHWILRTGSTDNVICYEEPASDNEQGAMFSIAVRKMDEIVYAPLHEKQVNSYMTILARQYTNFLESPWSTKEKFMNGSTYMVTYTAELNGTEMKGIVYMMRNSARLYAFHFRAPLSRYTQLESVMKVIRDSFYMTNT